MIQLRNSRPLLTVKRMASSNSDSLPIGEALRLLRTRAGLTQVAAGRLHGAPDHRTLSHWETGRKIPSLGLLARYLDALALDFCDLQEAMNLIRGVPVPGAEDLASMARRLESVASTVKTLESRLQAVELSRGLSRLEAL